MVVGQAFWASSGGALLAGARAKLVSVGLLEPEEVADALRQSAPVRWMASRQNLLPGLRNLRTLGWVMAAAVAPASEANSLSLLGVLVNIGKYHPPLLDGVLRPLLKSRETYQQDDHRVRQGEFFDGMGWARSGDIIFEMAKAFTFAPHRKLLLRRLAAARIRENPDLAEQIAEATRRWLVVGEEKDDLEREALMAELNPSNYIGGPGDAESEGVVFSYPAELWSRIGQ